VPERIRQTAISVASKVFETMFFISLRPQEEGLSEEASFQTSRSVLKGEIGFVGRFKGRLKLYLPSDLARLMASNFMGLEEEEVSESQMADMLNEVCNMICGNLVCDLDRQAVWDLTLPTSGPISAGEMEEESEGSGTTVDFEGEGHAMRLVVRVEN
jgi:CheY-specific phosphatase CheX